MSRASIRYSDKEEARRDRDAVSPSRKHDARKGLFREDRIAARKEMIGRLRAASVTTVRHSRTLEKIRKQVEAAHKELKKRG